MKKTHVIKSSALLLLAFTLNGTANADGHGGKAAIASGKALAFTCAGCHGTDGNSTGKATPSIAGMSETFLVDTMIAYKEGDRPSTIMQRIAKGYSEAEFEAMAKYFAGQKYMPAKQKADAALAAKGKELHEANCSKCHADGGTDPEDDAGFLKGQWSIYLQDALADFKSGNREAPKAMAKALGKIDDAGMAALIEYYKSM